MLLFHCFRTPTSLVTTSLPIILGLLLLLWPWPMATTASSLYQQQTQRHGFPVILGQQAMEFSSIKLADINGDGLPEILAGSRDGMLYALQSDGGVLWSFNVNRVLDRAARNSHNYRANRARTPIRATPAVGDITGDDIPEIVVAAGGIGVPSNGGVVAIGINRRGLNPHLLPNWPKLPRDSLRDRADGFANAVVASPAIGDIDGDGFNEVVYGALDARIYAWNANGTVVHGWEETTESIEPERNGAGIWVLDTIWSSPALADLDNDGVLDVVIGVDAHNGNRRTGDPWDVTRAGGYLQAYRGTNGARLWRRHFDENIASSPAVADIDQDGRPEIVVGTGTWYSRDTPRPNPHRGRYVTALNHDGTRLWRARTQRSNPGSPVIGDINGDNRLEVVIASRDNYVYAFDHRGRRIWRSDPRTGSGNQTAIREVVLGDYSGDGLDDVFVAIEWQTAVLSGRNGRQLTSYSRLTHDELPLYLGNYTISGAPALGDIDGNGRLELVFGSGTTGGARTQINVWELPARTTRASWPMFRGNATNSGLFADNLKR